MRPRPAITGPQERVDALRRLPLRPRAAACLAAADAVSHAEWALLAPELLELACDERLDAEPGPLARLVSRRLPAEPAKATRIRLVAALFRRWDGLLPEHRAVLWALPTPLRDAALQHLRRSVDPQDPGVIPHLAEQTLEPALVPHLTPMLGFADRKLARAADAAVTRMVLRAAAIPDSALGTELAACAGDPLADGQVAVLTAPALVALAEAAERYDDHRMRAPLLAVTLLPARFAPGDPGTAAAMHRLHRLPRTPGHPAHPGLRGLLRRVQAPVLRGVAWRWLGVTGLSDSAAERFAAAETLADHQAVLHLAHLALHPRRAASAGNIMLRRRAGANGSSRVSAEGPLPTPDLLAKLDEAGRAGVPRVLSVLKADAPARTAALEPLLVDPSPRVRLSVLASAESSLHADFCFDADADVARSAVLRSSAVGAGPPRFPPRPAERQRLRSAQRLRRSPHAAVRAIAGEEALRLDPFLGSGAAARIAARVWLAADPDGLIHALRERLAGDDEPAAIRAALLVGALDLADAVTDALADCIAREAPADAPARLAACCVMGLGRSSGGPTAAEALERAMRHPDARVRANALEARLTLARRLGTPDPALGRDLADLAQDPHHRLRANAIRGLLLAGPDLAPDDETPNPAAGLASMLGDDRRPHRTAALWLVERTVLGIGVAALGSAGADVVRRVVDLASAAEDPRERQRALTLAGRIEARFTASPRRAAPYVPAPVTEPAA